MNWPSVAAPPACRPSYYGGDVISKLHNAVGAESAHGIMGIQGVQQRAQYPALRSTTVGSWGEGASLACSHMLWSVDEENQDAVAGGPDKS